MFEIIPAIDILDGKCVRLKQGHFDKKTIYYEDPVKAMLTWEQEGAKRLHVVDLDGARTGTPKNFEIIKKIVERSNNCSCRRKRWKSNGKRMDKCFAKDCRCVRTRSCRNGS